MAVTGFGEIAEKLRRSTVVIHPGGRGSGSGVIWTSDGTIITNAHVARGTQISLQLWDGREFDATVASRDPHRDLAALRIDATNLPSAVVADSSQVRPGELAIAIGNPLGFVGALTTGVVHGVGPLRGLGSQSWVQADVRLAPGNSGGPLADARGRVIGINTMIAGRLALAIPSNIVQDFLSAGPSGAWLGVTVHPVRIPRSSAAGGRGESFGLVLLEVEPRSPASSASFLPGDILLGTEDKAFTSLGDLSQALQGTGARLLRLEFLRGDYSRVRRVTVQLGVQNAPRSSVAA
jgi:serine protease Do